MSVFRKTITVSDATGGVGVATANATSDGLINGIITRIYLEYIDSPPAATTDVTIVEATNDPAQTILTMTDAATDGWFPPMDAGVDEAGGAILQYMPIAVNDKIKVTITGANNGDGVVVTLVYVQ